MLVCSLPLTVAAAAPVYRWVDDAGHVHYGDTVPERYRARATAVDTSAAELTPAQQRAAAERAARAARAEVTPAAPAAASASRPRSAASAPPVAKRPAAAPTATTDCATWWRLFDESADCFGPYRTVGGGVKPEAFEHCTEVPEPPLHCRRQMR